MEPFGLIFTQLDMDSAIEPEFNDWYDTEHIPERLGIPGFLTGHRAERVAPAPRYIALYDLESLGVLGHEAYLSRQGDRRSPWTARMLGLTKTFDRRLYEQTVPGRETIVASHPWTVMRFVARTDADRATMERYVAGLRVAGLTARLYDGRERAAGEWLVLATTPDEPSVHNVTSSSSLGRIESYGPYVRHPRAKSFKCRVL